MDFDFLGSKGEGVSSGKSKSKPETESATRKPEEGKVVSTGKYKVFTSPDNYDKSVIQLNAATKLTADLPYVKRAVEYAVSRGYEIAATLETALKLRQKKEKVCTIHEADIMYRDSVFDNGSFRLLNELIFEFSAFLTEDDTCFSRGVFQLRSRWNKGLEWKAKHGSSASFDATQIANRKLSEIYRLLSYYRLPMHPEEIEQGFHNEFLKPEHLTWDQFNARMKVCKDGTIASREAIQESIEDSINIEVPSTVTT